MTAFLFSAAAMAALALSFLLPPLLRREAGTLPGRARDRASAIAVGLGLPLVAATLYAALGTPQAVVAPPAVTATANATAAQDAPEGAPQIGPAQIEAMVARLAERLKNEPDDVDGWRMLAHSYKTLRRFDAAVDAYRHLMTLQPQDADVLTDCAVALAMTLHQDLSGEPERLIDRALAINPNHVQALALKGSAAYEHGDYAAALGPWKKILSMVPAGSDMAKSIAASVEKAESFSARPASAPPR
jgi:cytochrome c-type biogenesis protein CcmH/NrfG